MGLLMHISPKNLETLGSKIALLWGDDGYSITNIEAFDTMGYVHVAEVHHRDGSVFYVIIDKWGNTSDVDVEPNSPTDPKVALMEACVRVFKKVRKS